MAERVGLFIVPERLVEIPRVHERGAACLLAEAVRARRGMRAGAVESIRFEQLGCGLLRPGHRLVEREVMRVIFERPLDLSRAAERHSVAYDFFDGAR